MITVPGFLLRRLYVKGSLRNSGEGFLFKLKNQMGSGYARKLMPLTVDGEGVPAKDCFFTAQEERFPFSAVSEETPFTLTLNRTTTIEVVGRTLDKGSHKIGLAFEVAGLGHLSFDFVDVVQEG
ncbi:MAG: hypothetical protein HYX93_06830 [Chloroflexi bacterium]|nr:hypothetical protein [Chloroflexota bacterium]